MRSWYDQKCEKCEKGCVWYRPEGPRPDKVIDADKIWPEGCARYGYAFSKIKPLADDCEGFLTQADKNAQDAMRARQKRR